MAIFEGKPPNFPQNKTLCNFHTTNLNPTNQSFPSRKRYILKKLEIKLL